MKAKFKWVIGALALLVLLAIGAAVIFTPGLNSGGVRSDYELVTDIAFDNALSEAHENLSPVAFHDLTEFEWTTVTVFLEGTSGDLIKQETGLDLVEGYYRTSPSLLVFCEEGMLVKLLESAYIPFTKHHTYSDEARLDDALGENTWGLNEPSGREAEPDCVSADSGDA